MSRRRLYSDAPSQWRDMHSRLPCGSSLQVQLLEQPNTAATHEQVPVSLRGAAVDTLPDGAA
eukprot:1663451-Pleurochrysis_carterae.AAC.1